MPERRVDRRILKGKSLDRRPRRLLPLTDHIGEKTFAGWRALIEQFVAARTVIADGRRADEGPALSRIAAHRLDQFARRSDAAVQNPSLPLRGPTSRTYVLA